MGQSSFCVCPTLPAPSAGRTPLPALARLRPRRGRPLACGSVSGLRPIDPRPGLHASNSRLITPAARRVSKPGGVNPPASLFSPPMLLPCSRFSVQPQKSQDQLINSYRKASGTLIGIALNLQANSERMGIFKALSA